MNAVLFFNQRAALQAVIDGKPLQCLGVLYHETLFPVINNSLLNTAPNDAIDTAQRRPYLRDQLLLGKAGKLSSAVIAPNAPNTRSRIGSRAMRDMESEVTYIRRVSISQRYRSKSKTSRIQWNAVSLFITSMLRRFSPAPHRACIRERRSPPRRTPRPRKRH